MSLSGVASGAPADDPTAEYLDWCRGDSAEARNLRGCVGMVHTEGDVPGWTRGFMQRPLFRSRLESEALCADLARLTDTVERLVSRLYSDKLQFIGQLGAPDGELELISAGLAGELARYLRADVLFEKGRPRLLELNNDCLAGLDMAKVNAALMRHDEFASFAAKYGIGYTAAMERVIDRLLAAAPASRRGERPTVALVEERGSGLTARFLAQAMARDSRIHVVHGEIDQLEVRPSGTYCRGERVDVVFRYFVASMCVPEDLTIIRALTEECGAGRLGMVPTLDSELLNRKSLFGWLWEPAIHEELDPASRELVERLVPWTIRYTPGARPGLPLETQSVERCMDLRRSLVLKPAEGLRSEGVLFGTQVAEKDWRDRLLRTDAAFVVQQRVWPDEETILEPHTGDPVAWHVNYGYFQFDGVYCGLFLRGRRADDEGPIGAPGGATRLGCAFDY